MRNNILKETREELIERLDRNMAKDHELMEWLEKRADFYSKLAIKLGVDESIHPLQLERAESSLITLLEVIAKIEESEEK